MTDLILFILAIVICAVVVGWALVRAADRGRDDDYTNFNDFQ